jgi:protein-L-isoaspartate O-methyltransferase
MAASRAPVSSRLAHPCTPFVTDPDSVAALAARYDALAYAALPHPPTHPDHLAAVATALGYAPAPPQRSRVLEVGCSDGANLLPLAATLPGATIVGCDVAASAIDAARAAAQGAGLANVSLRCEDLATLDPALGPFDYIVAHGIYSWVPPDVRDALFALARDRLAPGGLMYVSYNVLPGCRLRQAAWEMLRRHVDGILDPLARLDAARKFARLLADGARSQFPAEDALRAELRTIAQRSDSELFHDDFGPINDPVYFRDFAAHAARFGLAYLAEVPMHAMSAAGLAPGARQWLATLDPVTREEHVDLLRMRRFRRTLLRRAGDEPASPPFAPPRLASLQVSADRSLEKAAEAGSLPDLARQLDGAASEPVQRLLETLLARAPAAMSYGDALERLAASAAVRDPHAVLRDACVSGLLGLHAGSVAITREAPRLPRATSLARWQAGRQEAVTNLQHVPVRMPDALRALLVLLDGTRDRAALAAALTPAAAAAGNAGEHVERMLDELGRAAFLPG